MGKILDLSVFQEETLDIKTVDGRLLHIVKPTQRMVIEMMGFREIDENTPPEEIAAALDRIALMILNNNREGVRFDADAVAALSADAKTAILAAFTQFTTHLQSNPT